LFQGYTAAHFAAAWGQVESLRALIENGANVQLKNSYNETARDIAQRYSKYSCIEYIDWSGEMTDLSRVIFELE
jgi:ankyrin repeat protein